MWDAKNGSLNLRWDAMYGLPLGHHSLLAQTPSSLQPFQSKK